MSLQATPQATIATAFVETVLGQLALLFLSAGDTEAARHAATRMLAAYNAETEEELSLAAEIISFRLHALEALAYAAGPDLSLNKVLRLRGGAVSLSRESHKAQRKLDQLQRARRAGKQPAQPAQVDPAAAPASPGIDRALGLIEAAREATQAATQPTKNQTTKKLTWTQAYQQRLRDKRLARRQEKNQPPRPDAAAAASAAAIQAG
jgi:hypothetical protein